MLDNVTGSNGHVTHCPNDRVAVVVNIISSLAACVVFYNIDCVAWGYGFFIG
jgi:hypothetical protein